MEPILLIILFALLAFLSDQLGGKKKIPARPRRDIDAQLPPSVPQPWPGQRRDAPSPAHELQPAVITSPAAPAMAPADHQPQSTAEPGLAGQVSPAQSIQASRPILPPLTAETVQQAVVMAEILGRPKSWRQFQRR